MLFKLIKIQMHRAICRLSYGPFFSFILLFNKIMLVYVVIQFGVKPVYQLFRTLDRSNLRLFFTRMLNIV